jgi:predicted 2-oxoglutarate/Fe(II)-dependent dioxygenase YbiX
MNTSLIENNYIYIPNFISESRAKVTASNFKHHCLENKNVGDSQAPNSLTDYNFIDFLELLCERTPIVSEILGETVLPTYSYARVYKDGSVLERHRDRDACEISLTIHLDGDKEWPIYIQTPKGEEVELNLRPGDAMMYLGCDADHWRKQFTGTEYIQVFLHYVRSRGDKSYAYFDKIKTKEKPKQIIDDEQPEPIKNVYKKNLNDYIIVLENILSDETCDDILNEYANDSIWASSTVGIGEIDLKVRNVNEIGISVPEIIAKNSKIRQQLDDRIFQGAHLAIKKYNELFPNCHIEQDSGYQLLRYDVGQFYRQHTDSYKLHPRSVSCSFMLNDDYEGGEFAFFDRELKYKLKRGSALLFPSSFMYPHEIIPVTKGTRYSIITWFI